MLNKWAKQQTHTLSSVCAFGTADISFIRWDLRNTRQIENPRPNKNFLFLGCTAPKRLLWHLSLTQLHHYTWGHVLCDVHVVTDNRSNRPWIPRAKSRLQSDSKDGGEGGGERGKRGWVLRQAGAWSNVLSGSCFILFVPQKKVSRKSEQLLKYSELS